MKELQCHKDLGTISIYKFNRIRESISEGKPDYSYLLIEQKELSDKEIEFLQGVYIELLAQLPEVNTELISTYRVYFENYIKTKTKLNQVKLNNLKGENMTMTFAENNRLFMDYVNLLNENNTNFQIVEYYIAENIEEIFKEKFPNINYPNEFDIIVDSIEAFHTIDRYIYEVDRLKVSDYFKDVFKSETFIEMFIKSKIVILEDLTLYTDRLSEDFKLSDNYENFIDFRHNVFRLENMAFEPITEYDFFKEVVSIKQILGFDFDIHKVSVKEYYAMLAMTRAKIDKEYNKDKSV